jgi:GDP/UDP-N,N'-diacetylbacillosamine 2-epimerase (hydrolysing)
MGGFMLRVAVLTSSRADYSNYLPLLKKLKADPFFELKIIAFGTHVSQKYGNTVDAIYADGFEVAYKLETLPECDNAQCISKSMGKTVELFSSVWETEQNQIDLIICIGDRFEMFAAVSSSIPFTIPVAHLFGGDITLGAIDNVFRHAITAISSYHFTTLESSSKRISRMTGLSENIFTVGSLGLDNLNEMNLLTIDQFQEKFQIVLDSPVLVTFHPETVAYQKNEFYVKELISVLETIEGQIVITMPNTDTMSNIIREALLDFAKGKQHVSLVESLGILGYYSCIKHCRFMLGNSSSGIVEAASFGKYVINIGTRQKGRETGSNVIDCDIDKQKIMDVINSIPSLPILDNQNMYGDGKTANRIINIFKKINKS